MTAIVKLIIDGHFSWSQLLGNVLSLQGVVCDSFGNNDPLWSLAYEVWFYILAFAMAAFTVDRKSYIYFLLLIVLGSAIFTRLNSAYLFCWLVGAFSYIKRPDVLSIKMLVSSFVLLIYSVAGTQFGYDSVSIFSYDFQKLLPEMNVARITLSLSVALLIQQIILIEPKRAFTRKTDKLGTALASFSYTLYLTHFPVLNMLSYFGLGRANTFDTYSIAIFLFKTLSCLIVSVILYLMFERHTTVIKIKLNCFVNRGCVLNS